MRFKFFILLVLLLHSLGFAGFDPETLVVTPGGYQRMGRLQVGDPILSACKNNWHATAGQIQHRRACKQQFVIAIEYLGAHATVFIAGLIGVKLFKGSDNKYDAKPEINVEGCNNRGPGHEPDNDNDDDDEDEDLSDRINSELAKILAEASQGDKTKGQSKIYEKSGGFSDAQRDFNRLKLSNVRNIDKGKIGVLRDGRKVNVRSWSKDRRPTLEIAKGRKRIKIRYGKK